MAGYLSLIGNERMITFLAVLLILVSIFMVLVVLVQRGRGGGLSGAFGSGGGSNSAFGTKTGDVFTTVTVVLCSSYSCSWQLPFRSSSNIASGPGAAPVRQAGRRGRCRRRGGRGERRAARSFYNPCRSQSPTGGATVVQPFAGQCASRCLNVFSPAASAAVDPSSRDPHLSRLPTLTSW